MSYKLELKRERESEIINKYNEKKLLDGTFR
jgi:hypothetical protein